MGGTSPMTFWVGQDPGGLTWSRSNPGAWQQRNHESEIGEMYDGGSEWWNKEYKLILYECGPSNRIWKYSLPLWAVTITYCAKIVYLRHRFNLSCCSVQPYQEENFLIKKSSTWREGVDVSTHREWRTGTAKLGCFWCFIYKTTKMTDWKSAYCNRTLWTQRRF